MIDRRDNGILGLEGYHFDSDFECFLRTRIKIGVRIALNELLALMQEFELLKKQKDGTTTDEPEKT